MKSPSSNRKQRGSGFTPVGRRMSTPIVRSPLSTPENSNTIAAPRPLKLSKTKQAESEIGKEICFIMTGIDINPPASSSHLLSPFLRESAFSPPSRAHNPLPANATFGPCESLEDILSPRHSSFFLEDWDSGDIRVESLGIRTRSFTSGGFMNGERFL